MFQRIVNFLSRDNPIIEENDEDIIIEEKPFISVCIKDIKRLLMFNRLQEAQKTNTIILKMIEEPLLASHQKLTYINEFDDINNQGANMLEKSRDWVHERTIAYYTMLLDDSIERRHFETILLCSRRVLNCDFITPEKRQIIVNYFEDLLDNRTTNNNIKAEIADLFIKLKDQRLAELGRRWIQIIGNTPNKTNPANIYSHSQNVHSTGIESSAIKTLLNFGQSSVNITPYEAIQQIRKKYKGNTNIGKSLDRILIDTTQFSCNNMRLRDILNHVWNRIQKHPERAELYRRLGQELEDSTGVCSTGYLTRLVNVLATYDKDVVIAFSYEDEIYASLRTRILALAEKEPDSVMDGLCLTDDPKDAIEFIQRVKDSIKRELKIEYKDVVIDDFDMIFEKALAKFFSGY